MVGIDPVEALLAVSYTHLYQSVIGQGRVEFCPEEEKVHGLDVIMGHYHAEDFDYSRAAGPRTAVLRLKVESMTGKQRKVN